MTWIESNTPDIPWVQEFIKSFVTLYHRKLYTITYNKDPTRRKQRGKYCTGWRQLHPEQVKNFPSRKNRRKETRQT